MEETCYLDEGGIRVTNARFLANGQTYVMGGITSIKSHSVPPNTKTAWIMVGIGVLLLFALSGAAKLAGIVLAGLGVWWMISLKDTVFVLLSSSSGEVEAYSSTDKAFIERVIEALNTAIIHRG
jgi:hypothetical protein